jgi:hypothetical protein
MDSNICAPGIRKMAKPTIFEEEMEMTLQEKMRKYTALNPQYCMAFLTPVSNPNERKKKGKRVGPPPPQSPPSSEEEEKDKSKNGSKTKEDNKANLELLKKLYGL